MASSHSVTFRKRKAARPHNVFSAAKVGTEEEASAEDAEAESTALTVEELKVLQEFRAVGKRGISGDQAVVEGNSSSPTTSPQTTTNKPPSAAATARAPDTRHDVLNSVAISHDAVHNTQTWKPILEEVKLDK